MNKFQKLLIDKQQRLFVIGLLVAHIVTLFIIPNLLSYYIPAEASVEELIKLGDDAFRDYQYNRALDAYHRADRRTMELIKFETDSPSKDVKLLQHYHNLKTFLKVRVELTMTVQAISRLD